MAALGLFLQRNLPRTASAWQTGAAGEGEGANGGERLQSANESFSYKLRKEARSEFCIAGVMFRNTAARLTGSGLQRELVKMVSRLLLASNQAHQKGFPS